MKFNKLLFLSILLFSTFNLFAQNVLTGKVLEVQDGRTLVVETNDKSKFAVQLQFIEVPSPETKFAITGKSHLEKLVLNKTAIFKLTKIVDNRNIAKVLIDNVDLSQQLLLDGAAWYSLPEMDDQKTQEREAYQKLEQQAKDDKRGIWGLPELKPSWVIKAELEAAKEEKRIRDMMAENSREAAERQKKREKDSEVVNANLKLWADVPESAESKQKYAPRQMISLLEMKSAPSEFLDKPLKFKEVYFSISTGYYGFFNENDYYSFYVKDETTSETVYMKKGAGSEKLRNMLLAPGKYAEARGSVTLIIRSNNQTSSSYYPEILEFGPAEK